LGVIDPETGDAKIYRDCAIDVCWNCQQAIKNGEVKKYFTGTLHDYSEYWSTNYYVLASECTEEGLHLFGFDSLEDVAEYKSFHVVTANFN
jgi:hypothetical protein